MNKSSSPRPMVRSILVAFVLACSVSVAHAQATRTWVSGVGDDANPCSRTAPCKTFAGAISKTATGGEISVLDPGGFGGVTITKSINIISRGVEAGVLVSGTNAIIINAPTDAHVHLEGLVIEGLGTGLNGVRILQARNVSISDSIIRGFSQNAVLVDTNAVIPRVVIADTLIEKNLNGVQVKPTGSFSARVELDRVQAVMNTGAAVLVDALGVVRLHDSVITFNGTGLSAVNGGSIVSYGNNSISSNSTNGAPTSTAPLQ